MWWLALLACGPVDEPGPEVLPDEEIFDRAVCEIAAADPCEGLSCFEVCGTPVAVSEAPRLEGYTLGLDPASRPMMAVGTGNNRIGTDGAGLRMWFSESQGVGTQWPVGEITGLWGRLELAVAELGSGAMLWVRGTEGFHGTIIAASTWHTLAPGRPEEWARVLGVAGDRALMASAGGIGWVDVTDPQAPVAEPCAGDPGVVLDAVVQEGFVALVVQRGEVIRAEVYGHDLTSAWWSVVLDSGRPWVVADGERILVFTPGDVGLLVEVGDGVVTEIDQRPGPNGAFDDKPEVAGGVAMFAGTFEDFGDTPEWAIGGPGLDLRGPALFVADVVPAIGPIAGPQGLVQRTVRGAAGARFKVAPGLAPEARHGLTEHEPSAWIDRRVIPESVKVGPSGDRAVVQVEGADHAMEWPTGRDEVWPPQGLWFWLSSGYLATTDPDGRPWTVTGRAELWPDGSVDEPRVVVDLQGTPLGTWSNGRGIWTVVDHEGERSAAYVGSGEDLAFALPGGRRWVGITDYYGLVFALEGEGRHAEVDREGQIVAERPGPAVDFNRPYLPTEDRIVYTGLDGRLWSLSADHEALALTEPCELAELVGRDESEDLVVRRAYSPGPGWNGLVTTTVIDSRDGEREGELPFPVWGWLRDSSDEQPMVGPTRLAKVKED